MNAAISHRHVIVRLLQGPVYQEDLDLWGKVLTPPEGETEIVPIDRFEVQACRASMRHGIVRCTAASFGNLGLFFAQHATLECHGGLALSSLAEP